MDRSTPDSDFLEDLPKSVSGGIEDLCLKDWNRVDGSGYPCSHHPREADIRSKQLEENRKSTTLQQAMAQFGRLKKRLTTSSLLNKVSGILY